MKRNARNKKNNTVLPAGYKCVRIVDLQNNKQDFYRVNVGAALIGLVMIIMGFFIQPHGIGLQKFFSFSHYMTLAVAYLAYIVAHELTHGVVMKYYAPESVHFGYKGAYAYAGSKAYYPLHAYRYIALAPVVVWGIVFLILQFMVPASWWWVIWLLQIGNISGAAGDFYVVWLFANYPPQTLIQDDGVVMRVYVPEDCPIFLQTEPISDEKA